MDLDLQSKLVDVYTNTQMLFGSFFPLLAISLGISIAALIVGLVQKTVWHKD
jgi:hypothetical protein